MNNFIQVKKYLAGELKKCCDEYDKFLMIEIAKGEITPPFNKKEIKVFHNFAYNQVKSGYISECEVLKKSCANLSYFVDNISSRGLEKINDVMDYKQMLMQIKFEKHQGEVDNYTLLEWLSDNSLDDMQKVLGEA